MMNEILAAWRWNGSVSEPVPYGEGHINQTYALTVTSAQGAKRYILQKINTDTFKDPAGLMENICGVTDFLREKAKQRGADPARATLHVVPTAAEKPYYQAADGSCWRVYDFVENTVCFSRCNLPRIFTKAPLRSAISSISLPLIRPTPSMRRSHTSTTHPSASLISSAL